MAAQAGRVKKGTKFVLPQPLFRLGQQIAQLVAGQRSISQAQFPERLRLYQLQGQRIEPLGDQALEALLGTGTQRAEPGLEQLPERRPLAFNL